MTSEWIPIQIRTPTGADPSVRAFVVGMTDLIPIGYEGVRFAQQQYKTNLSKWRRLVDDLREKKSDPLVRWRLGNEINRFFQVLGKRHGIVITNQVEALSHDLGLSPDAVSFIVRMPIVFSRPEVETSRLTWSKFQELMGIKDPASMRECFRLLRSGKIKYDREIRAFKRAANPARTSGKPAR
jgi:hypothetical protein